MLYFFRKIKIILKENNFHHFLAKKIRHQNGHFFRKNLKFDFLCIFFKKLTSCKKKNFNQKKYDLKIDIFFEKKFKI